MSCRRYDISERYYTMGKSLSISISASAAAQAETDSYWNAGYLVVCILEPPRRMSVLIHAHSSPVPTKSEYTLNHTYQMRKLNIPFDGNDYAINSDDGVKFWGNEYKQYLPLNEWRDRKIDNLLGS